MAAEKMRVSIGITLTRDDGEHYALASAEFTVDRDDETGALMIAAWTGADVVEGIEHLITHRCEDDDRPVRLGDARN